MPPLPPPDVACVAQAVYHEARGATEIDKELAALLVWERSKDKRVSPCVIVHMPGQFPEFKYHPPIREISAWYHSVSVAQKMRRRPSKVRYIVSTPVFRRYAGIHVLHQDKYLTFYNRYNDNLWKGEYTYGHGTRRINYQKYHSPKSPHTHHPKGDHTHGKVRRYNVVFNQLR